MVENPKHIRAWRRRSNPKEKVPGPRDQDPESTEHQVVLTVQQKRRIKQDPEEKVQEKRHQQLDLTEGPGGPRDSAVEAA